MQRQPASPAALLLFSAGVIVLCLAMGCYFWIKWRVWRAGGKVHFANFGGFAAEFQLLRDYRAFAEQHNWSLLPLHALYACFALGVVLMLAATAAKQSRAHAGTFFPVLALGFCSCLLCIT